MKTHKIPSALMGLFLSLCFVLPVSAELAERSKTPEPEISEKDQGESWETVVPGLSLSEDEMRSRELRRDYHVSFPTSFDFIMDPFEIRGRGQVYSDPFYISNHGMEPLKITITELVADTNGIQPIAEKIISPKNKPQLTIGESEEMVIGKSEEETPTIGYSITPRSIGNGADVIFRDSAIPQYVPGLGMVQQDEDTIQVLSEYSDDIEEEISREKEAQILFHRVDKESEDISLSPKPAKPIVLILKENEDAVFELRGSLNPYSEHPWEKGDIIVSAAFSVEKITGEEADRLLEKQERGEELAEEEESNRIIRYIARPEAQEESEILPTPDDLQKRR